MPQARLLPRVARQQSRIPPDDFVSGLRPSVQTGRDIGAIAFAFFRTQLNAIVAKGRTSARQRNIPAPRCRRIDCRMQRRDPPTLPAFPLLGTLVTPWIVANRRYNQQI